MSKGILVVEDQPDIIISRSTPVRSMPFTAALMRAAHERSVTYLRGARGGHCPV